VADSVSISRRFNGPLDSGNGGYSAGVVASSFLTGAAAVNRRSPVPLDTALQVLRQSDGSIEVLDAEELIMDARSTPDFEIELPEPVSVDDARAAAARYRGLADGLFSRCFVCGRAREDAFGVFAGAVEGRDLVASPWVPPAWAADESGQVRPEFVWAVLDCPTYFALYAGEELPVSVLASLTARLDAPVAAGEEHVVIAWPIGRDGRKHHAGSAVLTADGDLLAAARALLVQVQDQDTQLHV
jgi:hypothetical protein